MGLQSVHTAPLPAGEGRGRGFPGVGLSSFFPIMNTSAFKIQPYTKKELALLYFPTSDPHTAVNRLMSWVNRCKPLHTALLDQGYQKTAKWLSPREVRLITEHLGEP